MKKLFLVVLGIMIGATIVYAFNKKTYTEVTWEKEFFNLGNGKHIYVILSTQEITPMPGYVIWSEHYPIEVGKVISGTMWFRGIEKNAE